MFSSIMPKRLRNKQLKDHPRNVLYFQYLNEATTITINVLGILSYC